MLDAHKDGESPDVALEPIDMEARAVEQGTRRSSVVLPPVGNVRYGRRMQARVEVTTSHSLDSLYESMCERTLEDLLKFKDRFSDSPTFLTRLASLYQLCGHKDDAVQYAELAAKIGNTPYFQQLLGDALLDAGHDEKAHNIFNGLAAAGYTDALLRLSELAINSQNFDDADSLVERAIDKDSRDWRGRLLAGTIALAQGNYERSIRHYRVVLEDKPNSSAAYLNLAIAHLLLNRPERALLEAKKSLAINPWNKRAQTFFCDLSLQQNRELVTAERYLKLYFDIISAEPQLINRLVHVYLKEKKLKQGISLLEKVTKNLNQPDAWNNLGVLWASRKPSTASRYFERAIDSVGGVRSVYQHRGASIALLNLANLLYQAHEYVLAERLLATFVSEAPDDSYLEDEILARIPVSLVRVYAVQDKNEQALDVATRMFKSTRTHVRARLALAELLTTYCRFVSGDIKDAIEYADAAYALAKASDEFGNNERNTALNNLIFVLLDGGDIERAQGLIGKLRTDVDPRTCVYVYATKGLYALRRGDLERGRTLYEKAVSEAPNKDEKDAIRQKMNLEIGRCFLERGDQARARRFLRKVVDVNRVVRSVWSLAIFQQEAQQLLRKL